MHPEWENFIHKKEGLFSGTKHDYGLLDLSPSYGLIKVSGDKAKTFLQGQLTCDMEKITSYNHSLTAHCDPKGRVIDLFWVFQKNNDYYLLTTQETLSLALKNLKKYAIFHKTVQLEIIKDDLVILGYGGEHADQHIHHLFGIAATNEGSTQFFEEVTFLHIHGINNQFFLIGPVKDMITTWEKLEAHASLAKENRWKTQCLLSGVPHIYPETSEMFTPHSINLPELNGVCFSKGCYTGQEIVARMHYLGKAKQKMLLFKIYSNNLLKPGDSLFVENNKNAQGTVVDTVITPEGYQLLLAVVFLEHKDSLVTENGVRIERI